MSNQQPPKPMTPYLRETHVNWLTIMLEYYSGEETSLRKRMDDREVWGNGHENEWRRYQAEAAALRAAIEALQPKVEPRPELSPDSPDGQFAAVLDAFEKGESLNSRDVINALHWRVRNQRREIARLHEKRQATKASNKLLANIVHAVLHILDDCEENAQTGIVSLEISKDDWAELNRVIDLISDDPHETLHELIGVNDEPPDPDGEAYRGTEYASAVAEEQARIQRELK